MVRIIPSVLRRSNARIWNVASQLSQSGVSFFAILALAHIFSSYEFGIISVISIVVMLAMSMNRSVLGEQLLATIEVGDRIDGYWKLQRLILCVMTALVFLAVFGFVGLDGFVACWFFVSYAASDAMRYALFTGIGGWKLRSIASVDLIRLVFAGAAALVSWTTQVGSVALALLILSNAPWIVYSLFFYRARRSTIRQYLAGLGKYEALISLQYLLATGATQCLPIVAIAFVGPEVLGAIRLTQSMLNPLAVLALSVQPTLIALLARRTAESAIRMTYRMFALALLGAALVTVIAVASRSLLVDTLVPPDMSELVTAVWIPVVVSIVAVIVGQPGGALIRVLKLGGLSLAGQVLGTIAAYASLMLVIAIAQPVQISLSIALGSTVSVLGTYLLLFARNSRAKGSRRVTGPD